MFIIAFDKEHPSSVLNLTKRQKQKKTNDWGMNTALNLTAPQFSPRPLRDAATAVAARIRDLGRRMYMNSDTLIFFYKFRLEVACPFQVYA